MVGMGDFGKVVKERHGGDGEKNIGQAFGGMAGWRAARLPPKLEPIRHGSAGLLKRFGREVIVANARKVKLIRAGSRKDDNLRPIQHRSEDA
jgi:hypothetical protein